MDQLIEELIEQLQRAETLYLRMLSLIEQEKRAAIASDILQLTAVNEAKESLVIQINRLESRRQHLARQIAGLLKLPSEKLQLSALAVRVQMPHSGQLVQLSSRLKDLTGKVKQSNEECRMLIRHCLRLVQNGLNFFHYWMGMADVYGTCGNIKSAKGNGRLLSGNI